MIYLYLLSLLPLFIGGIFWIFSKRINWIEWVSACLIALAVSGAVHLTTTIGMTDDIQTFSGTIVKSVHYPKWVEQYQQRHTRQVYAGKDSNGNSKYRTEVYYTTEYRTHHEHWTAYSNIDSEYSISESKFKEMSKTFQSYVVETPYKSGFYKGDRNVYVAYNKSGKEFYPVTRIGHWENKIKASPTTFSFQKVDESAPVYEWPDNPNPWKSDRLLGPGIKIDTIEWDRMNARLGPSKRINVILLSFGPDTSLGELQKAKWIGGKKNDLVLMVFNNGKKVIASDVFGWSDSELVKSNLKTILLNNPIDNEIIPKIELEIRKNYKLKDWSEFDYITIEPPLWSYFVCLGAILLTQTAFWIWAYKNEYDKDGNNSNRYYGRNRYRRF